MAPKEVNPNLKKANVIAMNLGGTQGTDSSSAAERE